MCDYIDDFDGEFDEGEFINDDFEDTYGEHLDDCEPEEPSRLRTILSGMNLSVIGLPAGTLLFLAEPWDGLMRRD